jgi:KaiC/GvpD/RAD55 family RecA-like ATPase
MSAKINYLSGQIIGIESQIGADNGKAAIIKLLNKAKGLLKARAELGEEPVRANVEGLVTQIHNAVTTHNAANQISMDSVADILAGFDAVVDPE